MSKDDIHALTLETLFQSGQYVIPIYQRNYAWEEGQITQLVQDINDFSKSNKAQKYYIGTLVVYEREGLERLYETIDGQQRLTTLSILYAVLRNEYALHNELASFEKRILDFENRKLSSTALDLVKEGNFDTSLKYNTSIVNAYGILKKELKSIFNVYGHTGVEFSNFVSYLNKQVVLLRVKVPKDTDLNHYFEIMNNRGEQLEKHEVLKSLLLGYLDKIHDKDKREKSKQLFNTIWEGCSQMERYIQYSFNKDQRHKIFGATWDRFVLNSFDALLKEVDVESENLEGDLEIEKADFSIDEIINNNRFSTVVKDGNPENPERFNTIINFQNFILHCLLLYTKDRQSTLDDKNLIKNFEFLKEKTSQEQIDFVKSFAFTILKSKFLLDHFIIKREFINNKDAWSLKKLFYYSDTSQSYIHTFGKNDDDEDGAESREIILLLSMFHTVAPNMMYKHWLNASLNYLYQNYCHENGININNYRNYLESFARDLVFRRFLSKVPLDYFDIIYGDISKEIEKENVDWERLRYNNLANNLVFNYIDYLLIKKELKIERELTGFVSFARNFEFTFRSSVEHYYPQNPKDGFDKLGDDDLHSIGNLTLISHSKNSAMNNYMPKAKKEHYEDGRKADSVKQYIMFNKYPDASWGIDEINKHSEEIIELLTEQLY